MGFWKLKLVDQLRSLAKKSAAVGVQMEAPVLAQIHSSQKQSQRSLALVLR